MKKLLSYALSFVSLLVVAGLYFDGYWHVMIGRESFFIFPHLLLYSGLIGLFFLLYKTKGIPKITWFFAGLIVVAAPFDDWWHRLFGVEAVTDLLVVWSPPHLIAEISIAGLVFIVFRQLLNQKDRIPLTLVWASFTSLVLFTLSPLALLGPYKVLGGFGGLIILFAMGFFINTYLEVNSRLLPYLVTVFLIQLPLNAHDPVAAGFQAFHEHLPLLLTAVVFLFPPLIVDVFARKKDNLYKTTIFLVSYVLVFQGVHVAYIGGYRYLWPFIVLYALLAYPVSVLAEKAVHLMKKKKWLKYKN